MCALEAPDGAVSPRSCALVYRGGEAAAVAHAMSLMGTLLGCADDLQGKRGLLICTRAAWEAAASLLGRSLSDNFDSCTPPCPALRALSAEGPDEQESLERLLRHAFRTESSAMQSPHHSRWDALTEVVDHDSCSQLSTASMRTGATVASQGTLAAGFDSCARTPTRAAGADYHFSAAQRLLATERAREGRLERLLVRFVDEAPYETLYGKRRTPFNMFVEPGCETKWNYIQAANEISLHPPDIGVVVVAGLSLLPLHRTRGKGHDARAADEKGGNPDAGSPSFPSIHPFDGSDFINWEEPFGGRRERVNCLKSYTVCLSITLNALQINVARAGSAGGRLPKLFFIDRLPARAGDHQNFITFLRNRFQFLYRLD
ncbi:5-methylthioadenosine phosphorylase, putative [Babesia caballi]|uniref:5-methylthioadenosine phosphorylase, putative n=1 Tax=Babesia caballi TaxID=5871 RepID=A0AAV4M2W8_BABCB|nr:5-methylthioadenosine phosphorylase, putative [Babesia caballi]